MKRRIFLLLATLALAIAAWAIPAGIQIFNPTAPLAAYLPQGALLTIESPDFATLLGDWSSSRQAAAWLKSDNYAAFSRSRLFGRLSDAQSEFQSAAGIPPDADFLREVAGKQSIFAWYDIGNLEFLYLTKLPPGKADQTRLLQSRASFSRRQIGSSAFYVRTRAGQGGGQSGGQDNAQPRTVAFATSGDWLLLSTREDLMAGALQLLEKTATESVATEPWYLEAQQTHPSTSTPPSLHMTLALDRLVRTPQFRTYWLQRNITDLAQYRSAVSDLYREPTQLREERVLIPKSAPAAQSAASTLTGLTSLVPAGTGVFRAQASPSLAQALTAIQEKIFAAGPSFEPTSTSAPDADLAPQTTGAASDLETRIDTPPPPVAASPTSALTQTLNNLDLDGLLTLDTAAQPNSLWIPIHSAVILHASKPIDAEALRQALTQSLAASLTTGTLGLEWRGDALTGPRPLYLHTAANTAILTSDPELLAAILGSHATPTGANPDPSNSTYIAGFSHDTQRAPYARLTGLIDHVPSASPPAEGVTPPFFSGNIRSLSDAFAAFRSEHMVQHPDGPNIHQTVTWTYQQP